MKKYAVIIKKIIVIIIGIIFALLVCEIFLRLSDLKPKVAGIEVHWRTDIEFIKWAYIDICNPFFKIENNKFYIQRTDLWLPRKIEQYPVKKSHNKKRVFIVGESTARNFDAKILDRELSQYCNTEIINAGMGGYDSYRIEKITKEIKYFSPDWIIILIGNNDGIDNYFNMPKIEPVDINSLPYRYKLFNKIYALNYLSQIFHPEIVLNRDNVEANFRNNIVKIIKNLSDTKIIFCDLPNNEQYQVGDIFESLKQRTSSKIYSNSLWKNTMDYGALLSRLDFLRTLADKYENIYITNLTETIRQYTCGQLDYNVFYDNFHFREETYMLLSNIITKIIVKKDLGLNIDIVKPQEYLNLLAKNRVDIPNHDIFGDNENDEEVWLQFHEKFGYNEYSAYFKKLLLQCKYSDSYKTFKGYETIYNNFIGNNNRNYDEYMYLVLYADVLQHKNEVKKSKKILKTLINLEPNCCEAYLIMGYICYKEHDYKKSDDFFDKVKKINKVSKINVSFLNSIKE